MRHDCHATEESLVELLFGEVEGGAKEALFEEVVRCERCAARYRSMAETLRVFDEAAETSLPAESFWDGYEERLRRRMAQEIQTDFWGRPAGAFARGEYRLTFVEDEGLTRRLVQELKAVGREAGLTMPEFKRDPFGFMGRSVAAYGRASWGFFSQRNVALATMSAFVFVTLLLGTVFALEGMRARHLALVTSNEEWEVIGWANEIPKGQPTPDEGPAGTNEGKGGGSKPKQEKPAGGGGGGRGDQTQASRGKLPTASLNPPIVTAAPQPAPVNPHLGVLPTMQVDPMLVKVDPRDIPYGLPNSTETNPSSGPGRGGGMGDGSGGGMGTGEGTGLGPGRGYNTGSGDPKLGGGGPGGGGGGRDYSRVFKQNEVTQRALITFKPEPGFTEEARKNTVTGTVRLRAVLSANGEVINISVVKGLADGLTEKAIAAARQIKFRPAQKDGHTVSQYVVLEYNFNIY